MSAKRYIVDASGVARKIKTRWIVDGSGVARKIKKRWVIDSTGTARLTYQYADEFSVTTGTSNNSTGFVFGGLGFITPTNALLGDGTLLNQLTVSNHLSPTPGVLLLQLQGAGVTSQSYITSLNISGSIYLPAAASYSQGAGVGQWIWSGASIFANGAVLDVIIQRT